MRLLLDAHVSGKKIGKALKDKGHDVLNADDPSLEGWDDPDLLLLAAQERRVLVTSNVKDFWPLAREWAAEERPHAGLIFLSSTLRHEHFGAIIRGVDELLEETKQDDWTNRALCGARQTELDRRRRATERGSYGGRFFVGGAKAFRLGDR